MARKPAFGIRLEPEEYEALAKAAKEDQRSLSALGRIIIVSWLQKAGHLQVHDSGK